SSCLLAGWYSLQQLGFLLLTTGSPSAFDTLLKVGQVLALIQGIVAVVGYSFCLFAPAKKGALGLAITALCLGILNSVLGIIFKFLPAFSPLGGGGLFISVMGPFG